MSTTLTQLRQLARGEYGLAYSATADDRLTDSFLTALINEELYLAAALTRAFQDIDLSISLVSGTMEYALSATLLELDQHSVRFQQSGGRTYTRLYRREYPSLLHTYGALEDVASSASVAWFYVRGGGDTSDPKKIGVVPKPNANGTLLYGGYIYPTKLSSDSDVVPFADGDCELLIPGVKLRIAEWEAANGRKEAPVGYLAEMADRARRELRRHYGQLVHEPPRAAAVAPTMLQGAEERRAATVAGAR